ncbi:MAG: hypothetical protein ABID63_10275 [Pseudomonadota bacterium]
MASYRNLADRDRTQVSRKPENRTSPEYQSWRRDDLYHLAQMRGIENRANMSNDELVQALRMQT